MLETVHVGRQSVGIYEESAGAEAVAGLRKLAAPLRGAQVLHLNATPYGGGVAEILRSEVPLLLDLGLVVDWKIITGDETFFHVTKAIHNGLQGTTRELTPAEKETYVTYSTRNARLLEERYDLIVIHDPQPLALLQFHGRDDARWVWRCHIDTAEPNPQVWEFLRPFLSGYDAAVFTLGGFVPPDFPIARVEIIPPAIDPESPKNLSTGPAVARRVLQWIGVDPDRPLVTQVSRFDPWKDPFGVIDAYRQVRAEIPDLQLAMVGSTALDDPEGWEIYRKLQSVARSDPGVQVFTNLTGVNNVEVNAFQRLSRVVIQKSMSRGQGAVQERFLLPRLIADELQLYAALLGERPRAEKPAHAGLAGEVRDPVCGMRVDPAGRNGAAAISAKHEGRRFSFCSEECRLEFLADPDRFMRAEPAS